MEISTFHILNGDALFLRVENKISGKLIVTRECLCDGNLRGDTLEAFFDTRVQFLSQNYEPISRSEYHAKVVSEYNKIQNIPHTAEVNLWFEDDLFCQVNFWFVVWLLQHGNKLNRIFLVRSKEYSPYSFAWLSDDELLECLAHRVLIKDLPSISLLWEYYKLQDNMQLITQAQQLEKPYPFILSAVQAHIDRLPHDRQRGKPEQVLLEIIDELGTTDFGPVFHTFCKRLPIYGYGDIQVKRMLNRLNESRA